MKGAEGFSRVYEDHVFRVYGFFGYRLSSREEAEDLTQQTFERALRAWDLFDENRASAATWLMAIARNLLIDSYRRDRSDRNEPFDEEALAESRLTDPEADHPSLGIAPELESALTKLTERQREVIALRFGADLNGPEIASLTGLTLANVQQILSRALRKLRSELGAEGTPARS